MPNGSGGTDVRTSRLRLTRPGQSDVDAIVRINGDVEATAHNPSDRIRSRSDAEALLEKWTAQWSIYGFGYWLIREAETDTKIGICGVKTVSFHNQKALNLFYRLSAAWWGQGIATEAVSAVLEWLDEKDLAYPLIARVRPENHASQRVLSKIDFVRQPELDDYGEDGPDWIYTRHPLHAN